MLSVGHLHWRVCHWLRVCCTTLICKRRQLVQLTNTCLEWATGISCLPGFLLLRQHGEPESSSPPCFSLSLSPSSPDFLSYSIPWLLLSLKLFPTEYSMNTVFSNLNSLIISYKVKIKTMPHRTHMQYVSEWPLCHLFPHCLKGLTLWIILAAM